jgi:hypothetical protein
LALTKKYRPPRTERERALVERFRAAGITLRIEDIEPGESRLMFFGAVARGRHGEEADA